MHKRHFFRHEAECRVVKWNPSQVFNAAAKEMESEMERCAANDSLPIDLQKALGDLVVSPLAPAWYITCVRSVVERFAPWLPVVVSEMSV
jgi:hypothetical protein